MTLPAQTPNAPGTTLNEQVRARIDTDTALAVDVGLLVIAALEGEAALVQALAGEESLQHRSRPSRPRPTKTRNRLTGPRPVSS